jgi:chaperonin GroES
VGCWNFLKYAFDDNLLAIAGGECQFFLDTSCAANLSTYVARGGRRGVLPAAVNRQKILRESRRIPMKFRPLHDRVVVRRIESEEKTAGGIIIPDTAKEKPQQGEVIAVGPGGRDESGKLIPIDVKVGDRVLFGKWSGTEVKIDNVEYLIMKESDIMGVLLETAARKKAA